MKYLRKRINNIQKDRTIDEVCHGCRYLSLIMTDTGEEHYADLRPMMAVCNRSDSEVVVLADSLSKFTFGAFGKESCSFKKVEGG